MSRRLSAPFKHRATVAPAMPLRPLVLVIHLLMAGGIVAVATHTPTVFAQGSVTAPAMRSYNIPAGALSSALTQFSRESGIYLVGAGSTAQGKTSQGLKGRYGVSEGLATLLAGTELEAFRHADGSYGLRSLPTVSEGDVTTLSAVTITAGDQSVSLLSKPYAGGQVASGVRLGVLGNISNLKAPFSTTSYTAAAVENQQSNTIAEAVNRDPSVRYTVLPGGNVDNLYIRGFPIWEGNSGEIAMDGVYGIAPNYRVRTEFVERIEVVKGPGALLFGMSPNGSVGGVINIAPKRAMGNEAVVTTTYTSDSLFKAHVDLSRRLGDDEQYGIRFNGSYYGGDTRVDSQSLNGSVGALALDYEGKRFRSTLDVIWQKEKIDGTGRPIMLAGNFPMPSAPDSRNNVTQSWEWSDNEEKAVLLRTEYDINDNLSVFANAGTSTAKVSRVYDSAPRLVSEMGNTLITPTYAIFDVSRVTLDGGLRSRFETGPVAHSVTLQLSSYQEKFDRALNPGKPVASNIYNPISYPEQDIARPGTVPRIHDNRNTSAALVDTMSLLDDRLQVSLGVRRQRIKSTNYNALSSIGSNVYEQSVTTPALGVVVMPTEHWSIYANYIEGLSKGEIAPPSAANYGEVMSPYKSKQYEIGTKYDFGSFMATASLFQIEKPSGSLDSKGAFLVNSEQRNRGLELYGYGELGGNVRLLGGVTFLDAKLTSSGNPALVGNRPVGVPKVMANLGIEWDVPQVNGLTLSGDLIYTGRQYVNATNAASIPAWTRLDLGLRYRTKVAGKQTTLRATVQNVADRNYWAGVTSWGASSPSTPRTFILSASMAF